MFSNDKLINFHHKHKKIATVTAVNPPVRFGELELKGNLVKNFSEVILGKGFDKEAIKLLKKKKNLRIIDISKYKIKNNPFDCFSNI